MPRSWSKAAVKIVAARPLTSPSKRFSIVTTPTGSPVSTSSGGGASSAGANAVTSNEPVAFMPREHSGMKQVTARLAGGHHAKGLAGLRELWSDAEEPGFARRMAEWLEAEGERRTTW